MDTLAKESGVARRTIYNQFISKEILFQAVIESIWFRLGSPDMPPEKEMTKDPAKDLYQIGLTIARHWAPPETQDFLRLIVREGDRFPHLAEDFYRMSKAPMLERMSAYFARLESEGIMAFGDKELAIRQFVGLIMEPLRWLRLIGIGEDPGDALYHKVVDEAVKTFIARYLVTGKTD
ncbi:TetR family transcriptional regulator [Enterobacillus tribolii]|uniref:TetR family transcriptional regulator n=2 Tax=Enterobacillus tribolii TaxID=1487935 RepID=A0A370R1J0_9GAMM|nr:TetR family transcriptional regulator [Enterobacillus tribolii]